jgi:hypothetical protein
VGGRGISNFLNYVEDAHLIPREQAKRYEPNDMSRYDSIVGDIDETANVGSLRADAASQHAHHSCSHAPQENIDIRKFDCDNAGCEETHRGFDKRCLVIVPKVAGAGASSASLPPQYVAHVLSTRPSEYWPTFHNSVVQYLHENTRPLCFPMLLGRYCYP